MKQLKWLAIIALMITIFYPLPSAAKELDQKDKEKNSKIPSHVLNISKENTYPNSTKDQVVLEPSELVEELINEVDIEINNPSLIKMLNETSLNPSPIAFGYRGMIYLGHWPLSYESEEMNINWEYQKVNTNQLNNLGGKNQEKMNYIQEQEKHVKGALTAKIQSPDEVKKMILLEAQKHTDLPLSFHTVIGKGTKKDNSYVVPTKKIGNLNAYSPAVSEKGKVTFGEVYIKLKGSDKKLMIKNVTKQGIGAWIPIQDHISFSFKLN
ncbi:YfkD family protein [Aquibacillus sp. 3ASR75-11]|uniref:YfkD family protein n=1 Tax=Terrihalobacillus insolitus TaxID=2950438 RepID=A0A9X3WXM4_9BACI|nr:YfkD famly protein [Terrihalobacillus insolitus]MDC3413460.1 YfkD family protein [Terrihalobacillus insolitus]MDC3425249.1 YfkD family protein [Terrihalobacillus insolitus]